MRQDWVGSAAPHCDTTVQQQIIHKGFGENIARSVPKMGARQFDEDAREIGTTVIDMRQTSGGFREILQTHVPTTRQIVDAHNQRLVPDAGASPEYRILYEHLLAVCGGGSPDLPAPDITSALSALDQEIGHVREALGIRPPCRYLLCDYDANETIGGLYSDYDNAAADANRLNNVTIISIPWAEEADAPVEVLVTVAANTTAQ